MAHWMEGCAGEPNEEVEAGDGEEDEKATRVSP